MFTSLGMKALSIGKQHRWVPKSSKAPAYGRKGLDEKD